MHPNIEITHHMMSQLSMWFSFMTF